jgi:hypothetical protein
MRFALVYGKAHAVEGANRAEGLVDVAELESRHVTR